MRNVIDDYPSSGGTSEAPFPPEEPVKLIIDDKQVVDTPTPQEPLAIPVETPIDPQSDQKYAKSVQKAIDEKGTSEAPFAPVKPNWYSGPDTIVQGTDGPVVGRVDLNKQPKAYHAAARILGKTAAGEDK